MSQYYTPTYSHASQIPPCFKFPTKAFYTSLIFPMNATCHSHLNLIIISDEVALQYILFIQSSIISSILGSNIHINMFSNTLSLMFFPKCKWCSSTTTQNKKIITSARLILSRFSYHEWYCPYNT
jgi:hypothetical protein